MIIRSFCIPLKVNWNPSYDEQAQDRSYRIGQKSNVEVVRLVARGTIEELMYARQVYKIQLKKQTLSSHIDGKNQPQIFRGVAEDKNRKGELFGIENLLKFKDGSFMQALVSNFLPRNTCRLLDADSKKLAFKICMLKLNSGRSQTNQMMSMTCLYYLRY